MTVLVADISMFKVVDQQLRMTGAIIVERYRMTMMETVTPCGLHHCPILLRAHPSANEV